SAVTDSDGTYLIEDLDPGLYFVVFIGSDGTGGTADASGYQSEVWDDIGPDGFAPDFVNVTSEHATASIDAALRAGGAITGQVTATGGDGLEGVQIFATAPASGISLVPPETDEDGNFEIKGLAPDNNYRVCFDATKASGGPSETGYI